MPKAKILSHISGGKYNIEIQDDWTVLNKEIARLEGLWSTTATTNEINAAYNDYLAKEDEYWAAYNNMANATAQWQTLYGEWDSLQQQLPVLEGYAQDALEWYDFVLNNGYDQVIIDQAKADLDQANADVEACKQSIAAKEDAMDAKEEEIISLTETVTEKQPPMQEAYDNWQILVNKNKGYKADLDKLKQISQTKTTTTAQAVDKIDGAFSTIYNPNGSYPTLSAGTMIDVWQLGREGEAPRYYIPPALVPSGNPDSMPSLKTPEQMALTKYVSGALMALSELPAATKYWHAAMIPGYQRWKPEIMEGTYRYYGCDIGGAYVEFTKQKGDFGKNLLTGQFDFPVDYFCGKWAFQDGDKVIVRIDGWSSGKPIGVIVGFAANPKEAPASIGSFTVQSARAWVYGQIDSDPEGALYYTDGTVCQDSTHGTLVQIWSHEDPNGTSHAPSNDKWNTARLYFSRSANQVDNIVYGLAIPAWHDCDTKMEYYDVSERRATITCDDGYTYEALYGWTNDYWWQRRALLPPYSSELNEADFKIGLIAFQKYADLSYDDTTGKYTQTIRENKKIRTAFEFDPIAGAWKLTEETWEKKYTEVYNKKNICGYEATNLIYDWTLMSSVTYQYGDGPYWRSAPCGSNSNNAQPANNRYKVSWVELAISF